MKKCPYCGEEYPDEYSVCTIDQNELESTNPKQSLPESKPATATPPSDDDTIGDDYDFLVQYPSIFEAKNLLEQFEKNHIRFQLEIVDKGERLSGAGIWHAAMIVHAQALNVYVHKDDRNRV